MRGSLALARVPDERRHDNALQLCANDDLEQLGAPARDWELVRAVQSHDPVASRRIHEVLRPVVKASLRRVLRGEPAEFEDLVQDTFERVLRGLANGHFHGRSPLTTWAYGIAKHVAMNWLRTYATERKHAEMSTLLAFEPQSFSASFERQLEARAEVRRIQAILGRMKSLNARVLVLHDVYAYSQDEVAQTLGIGLSAANSRLRRARKEFVRRSATAIPNTLCPEPT